MKRSALTVLMLAASVLICGSPLLAHHGSAAYDNSTLLTMTGTIAEFQFIQPHPIIALDTKDANGKVVRWNVEMTAPNHLVHYGWNGHKLHAGQVIKVSGHASKDGQKVLNLYRIYNADGQEIPLGPPPPPGQS